MEGENVENNDNPEAASLGLTFLSPTYLIHLETLENKARQEVQRRVTGGRGQWEMTQASFTSPRCSRSQLPPLNRQVQGVKLSLIRYKSQAVYLLPFNQRTLGLVFKLSTVWSIANI